MNLPRRLHFIDHIGGQLLNNRDFTDLQVLTRGGSRYEQARAFDAFLGLIPRKLLPDMIGIGRPECSAAFSVWLVEYMDTNAYDELGNYPDLVKLAAYEKARRAL